MDLEQFCNQFEDVFKKEEDIDNVIQEGRVLLSELMGRTDWFQEFLKRIILDASFRQQQKPSRWLNEYLLHRSPSGNFVVLAYIWEPYQIDVIHDHNSWGIIGTLGGRVSERKYRRVDEGTKDGYAKLEEVSHKLVLPGETTFVREMDKGIHRMENLTENAISINVYGKSLRQGYLHYYNFQNKTVSRAYVYPLYRAALAVKTLGFMEGDTAKNVLEDMQNQPIEDLLKNEVELSLVRLNASRE
ncbi:MAG: cysteine dioxygenase family protein [Deltaproteobacteria bacterium]|nr:cysteine dioxygenase family protein [Deltaproteobacteria bacterium]